MGHINLSRGASAIVVAPASADFLAKVANGHADDLLSTLALARDCPMYRCTGDEPSRCGRAPLRNATSRGSSRTA
jgi:phosphopantothenoylcysteine synthetase/decarboxylase